MSASISFSPLSREPFDVSPPHFHRRIHRDALSRPINGDQMRSKKINSQVREFVRCNFDKLAFGRNVRPHALRDHATGRYRPKHQGSVNLLQPIIILDQGRRSRQRNPIVLSHRREPSRAPDWRTGKRAGLSRLSIGQTCPRCVSDIYGRAASPQVATDGFRWIDPGDPMRGGEQKIGGRPSVPDPDAPRRGSSDQPQTEVEGVVRGISMLFACARAAVGLLRLETLSPAAAAGQQ